MPRQSSSIKQVVRNGNVYWRARASYPYDPVLGYKPEPKVFYGKTAKEAKEKRDNFVPSGGSSSYDKIQFSDYITTVFIPFEEARYNNGDLSWDRYTNRKSRLRRFLVEPDSQELRDTSLRAVSLSKCHPRQVEAFFTTLAVQGVSGYNRYGLYHDLRLALSLAKHSIPFPPASYFADVKKPSIKRKVPKVYDDATIFAAIMDETKPLEDRAFVAFLFFTQCRPSEMFALTWADFDLAQGTVGFKKATRRVRGGYDVTSGTKTDAGTRTIPIGTELCSLLRSLQKQRMSAGTSTDWVFHHNGTGLNNERCRYKWKLIKRSLGLPDGPTLYSLKKTGNSFLARQGVSAEVRAKIMGHTTPRMAMTTYRDIVDSEVVKAATLFDSHRTSKKGTG